jgi:hypothetical protein
MKTKITTQSEQFERSWVKEIFYDIIMTSWPNTLVLRIHKTYSYNIVRDIANKNWYLLTNFYHE